MVQEASTLARLALMLASTAGLASTEGLLTGDERRRAGLDASADPTPAGAAAAAAAPPPPVTAGMLAAAPQLPPLHMPAQQQQQQQPAAAPNALPLPGQPAAFPQQPYTQQPLPFNGLPHPAFAVMGHLPMQQQAAAAGLPPAMNVAFQPGAPLYPPAVWPAAAQGAGPAAVAKPAPGPPPPQQQQQQASLPEQRQNGAH